MLNTPALRRLARSLRRVGRTHYPRFVFGGGLRPGEIPVFIYHDVVCEEFRADLEFLRRNGYRCLRTGEYLSMQRTGGADGRAVLLTFDDAVQNFHDVALPLLREFAVPATLFVPTFWMRGARRDPGTAAVDAAERAGFMSWGGLRDCLSSTLVDVQLHGHRHALVHTSARTAGFATPELLARHHLFDWPMRREGGRDVLGRPPLGTPIYEAHPLLSAGRRVLEDGAVTRACREYVAAEGGAAFFARPDWKARLGALLGGRRRPAAGAREIPAAKFRALVASEYEAASELFERELGVRPHYLAYPWQLGSTLSLELARAAGIEAVFGVGIDYRRAQRLRGPLPAASRTKGEWLRFLPGRGRRRLREVIPEKVRSFTRSQHLAH